MLCTCTGQELFCPGAKEELPGEPTEAASYCDQEKTSDHVFFEQLGQCSMIRFKLLSVPLNQVLRYFVNIFVLFSSINSAYNVPDLAFGTSQIGTIKKSL